ncbi:specifically androgen-regulated gene protein [Epinephelus fuscoguttatus]|uniref:specifically androgen-regulated gene protein n=1 Tax=Epinephelus fuscoguttatus TaxID=293821 RepID=UPI0020D0BC7D|nr:specifically androgen-regulated gene protein [Epinephelus fuscoguttatus]XP_049428926.1 specifically androgen-regulated gene protein [Epinephelus fuscoguttatus]
MPKSDTWPGGIGLETMTGMDSAGSCDSVVSANSGFSDDSLEHLSAEEKACLMFLEETIGSLDTEEDSGLSNDEPDQLPSPGNLATKLADLSASMSKSKLNSSEKHASKEPTKENDDTKPSYLVPTPLVVASISPCSPPKPKPGVPPDKNLSSNPHFTLSSNKPDHKHNQKPVAPQVPLEVNVVVPPPPKPRDYSGRTPEGLHRGPLSYEALVHLRRSASTKKTPLCPKIDHTIELDKHLPVTEEGQNLRNLPRSGKSFSEASMSKTGPPVVAPKPKKIPTNIAVKTPQSETSITSENTYNIKNAKDPQVVRLEALQKLGLLKDQEPEDETAASLSPPKSHSCPDPAPNRFTSNVNPLRSPSFCYPQVPTEPKSRPLQSSASFHHYSRRDQQPVPGSHPAQSNGLKAAGLERSATLDHHRNGGNCQPVPPKPTNSVGYTVMVVPGMGADRKEALRKLGLLKD